MQYNRNPLYTSMRYALATGAVAGMALSGQAFAQEDPAELERVETTGSRLSQVDIEGAQPVTVLDRDDIERIGLNDLADVIRQLPSISGSPLSTRTNNGGDGTTLVDIRGFGAARTLVLINGRRDITDGDFSLIPIAAVERIEVLKEGAAAIYGADAVSGVVNIITRQDFSGAQLQAQYGAAFDLVRNPAADLLNNEALRGSDGDNKRVSFVMGDATDKSSFMIGVEYNEQDPVFQGNVDSPQFQFPLAVADLDDFLAGGLDSFDNDINGNGDPGLVALGSSRTLGGFFNVPGQGVFTRDLDTGEIRDFDAATDLYNFAPTNFIQTPFERTNVFVQGTYDLFDNVEAFVETRYANRRSNTALAPLPFDGRFDPGFGTGGVSADNVFNPFGVDVRDIRRRTTEIGGRDSSFSVNTFQLTSGLRGNFGDFAPTWEWEAFWGWGREESSTINRGQFVGSRLTTALGPSFFDDTGTAVCGTPDAPIDGCVPLDLFGGAGTITQEMIDFVSAELVSNQVQKLQNGQISFRGDVIDLPAGPLSAAFGYEFRKEELSDIPDSGIATGAVTGNTGGPTTGEFDVDSLFAEINIPLLSGVPGAELLEVGAGFRYDDFNTIGDTGNLMFTLRWQPFEGVLVRGSYSEVFREPTLFNLFSPESDNFPQFQDICSNGVLGDPSAPDLFAGLTPEQQNRCIATGVPAGGVFQTDTQVRSRVGGNPNVTAENGETWTAGIAWSPNFLPGFSATIDYWEISLDNAITNLAASNVVTLCVLNGLDDSCQNINRFADGNFDSIITISENIASEDASGVDFALNYNINTGMGMFDSRVLVTWNDERVSDEVSAIDAIGRFENRNGLTRGVFPEFKGLFTTDWSYGNFGASLNIEFIDAIKEFDTDAPIGPNGNPNPEDFLQRLDPEWYVDLTGRYNFAWGTQVSLGVTNLFDNNPPFIIQEFNANTDTDTFRPLGRSWFARITHNF